MGRAITADFVYTGNNAVIPNGVVEFNDDGLIEHIGLEGSGRVSLVEKLNGSICPAFINTHCHLELSNLKGKLVQKSGLPGFIQNLQKLRIADEGELVEAMISTDAEMRKNGIVAVGDISNSELSFTIKQQSSLYYHSFIELFGFDKQKAENIFLKGKQLEKLLKKYALNGNVSPHSPYSVSFELMEMIAAEKSQNALSIHNQETEEENRMYRNKQGKMMEMLQSFQLDTSNWKASNTSSLQGYLGKLPTNRNLLLVHNTFTSVEDIQWAESNHPHLYWCFCPKANLYIEGRLPDIPIFVEQNVRCTLGTDSLASNDTLSILDEMKCIQEHFPSIGLETLLQWACYNAAEFLGLQEKLGSIEVGKKPGILLLENLNNARLTDESKLQRIL